MSIKEALEMVLEQGVSKYRIAKVMNVQAIMVDKLLKEKQTTIRREAAIHLENAWGITIDDEHINGCTEEEFRHKHQKKFISEDESNSLS